MSMNYHNLYHKMWTDKNGTFNQILKQHGRDAAFLAMYLITSPHAEQSGLYHCPLIYMAHHTGIPEDQIEEHLNALQALGFCKYDYEADVIWIIKMVKYQVAGFPHSTNKQIKGIINKLDTIPSSFLLDEFRDFWGIGASSLSSSSSSSEPQYTDSTVDGLPSPSQALHKPLVSPLDAAYEKTTEKQGKEASL